jgi:hypothetical protein
VPIPSAITACVFKGLSDRKLSTQHCVHWAPKFLEPEIEGHSWIPSSGVPACCAVSCCTLCVPRLLAIVARYLDAAHHAGSRQRLPHILLARPTSNYHWMRPVGHVPLVAACCSSQQSQQPAAPYADHTIATHVEKKTEEMERRERDSRMVEAAGTLFHY